MAGSRSGPAGDLLLVATTAILILSLQRHFRAPAASVAALPAASSGTNIPAAEPGNHPVVAARLRRISWPVWKDILQRSLERMSGDRLLATAAGVVFYGLLAIFPAVTALVSSYALFADPSTISDNLHTLALMLPEGSFAIVQDQVARVLAKGSASLGITFLFGLMFAIWSANAGVKAIIDAINVAYEAREQRSFIRLNLVSLAFTIGAIVAMLLMVSAVIAFPLLLDRLGLEPESQLIVSLGRWPLLFIVLLVGLGLLYRFGPSHKPTRWQWLSVGTVSAALLWIGGSALLSWYLSNFGDYDATYGSLGAAIGLMMWMWMSAIILLFGAELNSEIERHTLPDARTARAQAA